MKIRCKGYDEYPDGRQVCHKSPLGRMIYRHRTLVMRREQGNLCCLCGLYMREEETTFEHSDSRGMGGSKRDDRIELEDGTPINGAAHAFCNGQKGSRKVPYVVLRAQFRPVEASV